MTLMMVLAFMHEGDACFPAGGSLEFARAIERRYLASRRDPLPVVR